MIDIHDFEACEPSGQFYGGNAGRKIGLVWKGCDWLVKFPGKGAPIAPLKYIMSGQDGECTKALDRFMERYDPRSFHDLLDSIPSMSHGLTVAPEGFHDYHRRVCDYRYEHAFVEAWRGLHPAVGFPSRPEPSEPETLPDPDPSIMPSASDPTGFDGPGM